MANQLTPRIVAFVAHNEAIVPEAYKDALGVWTWGMGLASTGGYKVMRYKDNPAPIVVCLRAAINALTVDYLPAVNHAFSGREISEAQLAAALSFHWNTHAILHAQWVKDFMAQNPSDSNHDLRNNYVQHGILQSRRDAEADLFFHGKWPDPMNTLIYEVVKPSYRTGHARTFDPFPTLQQIMGGN